jgi:hypothetical protein
MNIILTIFSFWMISIIILPLIAYYYNLRIILKLIEKKYSTEWKRMGSPKWEPIGIMMPFIWKNLFFKIKKLPKDKRILSLAKTYNLIVWYILITGIISCIVFLLFFIVYI